ncbi:hypothetical protein TIFTF001_024156 [Ficus carica]|uniref:Uncharacterized protein n=1 Tax=Ficus carica TaxID=3494 RepID=A0AA88DKB4_FICCA|nr:hypothetical protein TIFTF001_024156 [Ficus carica]
MNSKSAARPTSFVSTGLKDDTDVAGSDALTEATHSDHSEEKFQREREERDSGKGNEDRENR